MQWFYFDSLESLPEDTPELPEDLVQPTGSRYDGQVAIFGADLQKKMEKLKFFVVSSTHSYSEVGRWRGRGWRGGGRGSKVRERCRSEEESKGGKREGENRREYVCAVYVFDPLILSSLPPLSSSSLTLFLPPLFLFPTSLPPSLHPLSFLSPSCLPLFHLNPLPSLVPPSSSSPPFPGWSRCNRL